MAGRRAPRDLAAGTGAGAAAVPAGLTIGGPFTANGWGIRRQRVRGRPRQKARRPGAVAQHVGRLSLAGVPGLEPRLTEPESVGLPITLYPTGHTARSHRGLPDRAAVVY